MRTEFHGKLPTPGPERVTVLSSCSQALSLVSHKMLRAATETHAGFPLCWEKLEFVQVV